MAENSKICIAFFELAELATALGAKDINQLPGCWEHQIDDRWWVALNGHDDTTLDSTGTEVPPFNFRIVNNGWPGGSIGPYDGIIVGPPGTEDAFIAAVQSACEKQHDGRPE